LGSSSWERLPGRASNLLLQGNDIYDVDTPNLAGAGLASIGLSTDRGTTWTTIGDPCYQARNGRTAAASAAPGGVLALLCVSNTDSSTSLQISTDRGRTFDPPRAVPRITRDTYGPIAAASADTIAVAYRDQQNHGVWVTHDGGLTWRATLVRSSTSAEDGLNPSLGWEDARTARVSFNTKFIWTTRDGGRSWTRDRVTP
jgi:hypothetical protein